MTDDDWLTEDLVLQALIALRDLQLHGATSIEQWRQRGLTLPDTKTTGELWRKCRDRWFGPC